MPDVVVVGGGIIGAACAYELAVRGASVTLVEREHLAPDPPFDAAPIRAERFAPPAG